MAMDGWEEEEKQCFMVIHFQLVMRRCEVSIAPGHRCDDAPTNKHTQSEGCCENIHFYV